MALCAVVHVSNIQVVPSFHKLSAHIMHHVHYAGTEQEGRAELHGAG